jgi:hypothetical protein
MPTNTGGFGGVSVGKPTDTTPTPKPKPNENLTASLRATLQIVKAEDEDDSDPIPSPLNEATPDSVNILLDRINNHMIEGKILTDADLRLGIDLYRSQALRYAQEQETKKPRARSGAKSTLKQVLDLDDLDFDAPASEQ